MPNYTNDIGYDFAIHSDFLVHWTGKDIDPEDGWDDGIYSKTDDKEIIDKYIKRLEDILKYGFWMTEDPLTYPELQAPKVPQTCFTELKLSQARRHARKFGRLGIGVKRGFLFDRGGRPVIYYGWGSNGLSIKEPLLDACRNDLKDQRLLNFFKPMNTSSPLNYDLYNESEWRILATDKSLVKAVSPEEHTDYYQKLSGAERAKLKYLLPIDNWLGIIIYPSLKIKEKACENSTIISQIHNIISKSFEQNIWPIEVDLDACRNF